MSEITIKPIGHADVVSASNGGLNVTIPIKMTRRGPHHTVTLPDGAALQPKPWDSGPTPIQAALARGHRWLAMIESGKARNLAQIAEIEKMDPAYLSRIMNLTTLAPDIVAAILDETLPNHVTLFDLASGTPLLWDEQRALLQGPIESSVEAGGQAAGSIGAGDHPQFGVGRK